MRLITPVSCDSDIFQVSGKKKHTGSSEGMQNSVKTSELLPYRAKHIIPKRMEMITTAILDKDFKTFAEETIKVRTVHELQ